MRDIKSPLSIVSGIMILISVFYPWWTAKVIADPSGQVYYLHAYPYVLSVPSDFPQAWEKAIIRTPYIAQIGLEIALIVVIVSSFVASFLQEKIGKRLLLFTSFFFLLYLAGFYGSLYYACTIRIARGIGVAVKVQGTTIITMGGTIIDKFNLSYYLAIAAGILYLISYFVYGKISLNLNRETKENEWE
jgi:hypothetical protein